MSCSQCHVHNEAEAAQERAMIRRIWMGAKAVGEAKPEEPGHDPVQCL